MRGLSFIVKALWVFLYLVPLFLSVALINYEMEEKSLTTKHPYIYCTIQLTWILLTLGLPGVPPDASLAPSFPTEGDGDGLPLLVDSFAFLGFFSGLSDSDLPRLPDGVGGFASSYG